MSKHDSGEQKPHDEDAPTIECYQEGDETVFTQTEPKAPGAWIAIDHEHTVIAGVKS